VIIFPNSYATNPEPDPVRPLSPAEWARDLLNRSDWVILDTETTGLGVNAEIVQVAVVDHRGETLLDTLVRPLGKVTEEAAAVHGFRYWQLRNAPFFPSIYPDLLKALTPVPITIVAFNAPFDQRMLAQTCGLYRLDPPNANWSCAMRQYSKFVGEWSKEYNNFRWQPLPGGNHSASGDVMAVYDLIHSMAKGQPAA